MTQQSLTESQKLEKKQNGSNYSLDYGQKVKNVSDRSFVLAPFNSTITKENASFLCTDISIKGIETIKFNDRVREANRQYEFNYNGEVDNGIMISVDNGEESKDSNKKDGNTTNSFE